MNDLVVDVTEEMGILVLYSCKMLYKREEKKF